MTPSRDVAHKQTDTDTQTRRLIIRVTLSLQRASL